MLSFVDQMVLVAYLLGMVLLGLYFSTRNQSTERYFLGGRAFPGWAIGLSLVGTSISSITFLAYPADSFLTGWLRYLPNLMLPLAVFISIRFFLPHFRKSGITTAYELLEERFGRSIRQYAAGVFILAQVVRVSIILYLLSLLAQNMLGIEPMSAILCCGLLVGLYTYLGGIEAVIWTDVVQTVLLAFGGILCIGVIIYQLPGGLQQIIDTAMAAGKFNVTEWQRVGDELVALPTKWQITFSEKTLTMMLVLGLVHWLTEYSTNQNTVQRFCAAKSTQAAKNGLWVCALASLPIWAFYMFLGTALWVFFAHVSDQMAQSILVGEVRAEQIMPYFISQYLPVGVVGLIMAAAIAAAMSSLDSSINSIATVATVDFYKLRRSTEIAEQCPDQQMAGVNQAEKESLDDRQSLRFAKRVTMVVTVTMMFGAWILEAVPMKTLQDSMTALVSVLSGGLFGLFCLAFFTRVDSAKVVWVAIVVTIIFCFWATMSSKSWIGFSNTGFDLYYTAILANLLLFVVGLGLNWSIKSRRIF